jgi:hypothetical protein
MSRVLSDDLAALRDDYVGRVNTVLEEGREDLASELAAAYEVDRVLLASRGDALPLRSTARRPTGRSVPSIRE